MVVPQRAEHVLDLLPSRGDHTDVAALALKIRVKLYSP
jgi:hypothetical protein